MRFQQFMIATNYKNKETEAKYEIYLPCSFLSLKNWSLSSWDLTPSLFNISSRKSLHVSMGPGKHQCTQSLYNVTFSWGQCPYLLGWPSGLNNIACVVSSNLYLKPFFLPSLSAFLNSSTWAMYSSKFWSSNFASLLLNGLVLTQFPPWFHNPFSKCDGA